jgi:long-chain fatty acid transport protein
MDPGAFMLPHAHVAQPLPCGFVFGLGFAPEFGLGTRYNPDWALNWNTTKTTVRGLTLTPNLAYSITEDWSVSAGFRMLYFDFDQYSYQYTGIGATRGKFHLKGDNGFTDWGWQVSTRYRVTETVSVGAMYKSYIDSTIKGHATMNSPVAAVNRAASGTASADIRLPQSVTVGGNWDVTETVHLGTALTWTEWSSMPAINFNLPVGRRPTNLRWDDVFRVGFGGVWDFHENFSLLGSYVYDMDPCSTKRDAGSTMLPPGDRHIGTVGLAWHYGPVDITLSYGLVFMDSESVYYTHPATRQAVKFDTENGLSHAVGVSLTYVF